MGPGETSPPARQYVVNGERYSFALLRRIVNASSQARGISYSMPAQSTTRVLLYLAEDGAKSAHVGLAEVINQVRTRIGDSQKAPRLWSCP